MTNSSQTVTGTLNLDSFGNQVGSTGSSSDPYTYEAQFAYRNDGDAGLTLVGARYYDAQVGRFASRDTWLDQAPYTYCGGDPVNRIDLDGHWARWISGALAGAGASIVVGVLIGVGITIVTGGAGAPIGLEIAGGAIAGAAGGWVGGEVSGGNPYEGAAGGALGGALTGPIMGIMPGGKLGVPLLKAVAKFFQPNIEF